MSILLKKCLIAARYLSLLIVVLHFSFTSLETNVQKYETLFKCSPTLDEAYGLCTHINRRGAFWDYDTRESDLFLMTSVGASFLRTDWSTPMQMTRDNIQINFQHFDKMMEDVVRYKMKVLGIITVNKGFNMSMMEQWKDYVSLTANHYKKNIHCWEIINEVDHLSHWAPDVKATDYVALLKNGYSLIKEEDQNAKVLFSGLASVQSPFIDKILSNNVESYFDIMNVHTYCNKKDEPEDMIDFLTKLEKKLNHYNIDKPIWMTECGCSTALEWAAEETQAQRLPRIFLISFALGVDKVFWYKTRSNELTQNDKECFFGIVHKDYSPKPAYYAFQTLTKMCPDKSDRPVLQRRGRLFLAKWTRIDGKKVYALWTSKDRETVKLEFKGDFNCFDVYGKEKFFGTNVEVSPSIMYFIGDGKLNYNDE